MTWLGGGAAVGCASEDVLEAAWVATDLDGAADGLGAAVVAGVGRRETSVSFAVALCAETGVSL